MRWPWQKKRPRRPDAITLAVEGLPTLTWSRSSHQWECETILPVWSGFTMRYTTEDPPGPGPASDGKVWLSFDAPNSSAPPSAAQLAAYRRLTDDGHAFKNAVLQAVFDEFVEYLNRTRLANRELGGPLTEPLQLTRLIALNLVNIGAGSGAEEAPVELDFDASWDTEHGFMVRAESGRVTYVGSR